MRQLFAIQRAGMTYQFSFTQPAFGLFRDLPALLSELFSALGQDGFSPSSTRFSEAATLGDIHLQCDLPGATIKVFIDRVDLSTTTGTYRRGIATSAIEAVSRYLKKLEFSAFAASCYAHGTLAKTPASDFLRRFVGEPPKGREQVVGSATVFYFGADGPSLTSSLTLEMSTQISGGLFIQEHVVYDPSKIAASEVEASFHGHIEEVLTQLDLEVAT